MNIAKNDSWGLKLLALVLAVIVYHALKNGPARSGNTSNDRPFFQQQR